MKFSWNWLSDWVDLSGVPVAEVADRFTMTVAELEGVEPVGQGLRGVLVGRIAALEQHPNADKLKVVDIDLGDGRTAHGVSGAPNLAVGARVPVALPGTVLPGGVEVKAAEIRGVASAVVLLSEREMGLSDDHSGVMLLADDAPLGASLPDVLPVEDWVFEVDNKSLNHRPDLWGHHGLAREIAAMLGLPLKPLADTFPVGEGPAVAVQVDDAADCPRYMAMAYSGVTIAPSPFYVRHRLRAVGLRPINNVVDITNYVMMALGEPVHAFDRRTLTGGRIVVRRAAEGEPFRLLDGRELKLTNEDLVIADAERPVALAGVMGGEHSGIADDTTDVLLECATFHPGRIRRAAVRHAARTDSSTRFEKSLDPNLPPQAMALFAQMLGATSPGAKPATQPADVASFNQEPLRMRLDPAFVSRRLGMDVPAERTRTILEHLGFGMRMDGGVFEVVVPSWRATKDVSIPEDLLEEVGRVIGYDQVPPDPPKAAVSLVARSPRRELMKTLRQVLAGECGLDEVLTYSFDSRALLARLTFQPPDALALVNPISADMTTMRTDLAPNLLGCVERNAARYPDAGLFEVGRVFRRTVDAEGVPLQPYHLCLASWRKGAKGRADSEVLFRRVKGAVEHLFGRLDLADVSIADDWTGDRRPWMHPNATVAIRVGDAVVGWMGLVHPATMQALDVPAVAVLAEIDVDALVAAPKRPRAFTPVPRFPSITYDLSLVAGDDVRAGALAAAIRRGAGPFLAGAELVAVYSGPPIPEGRRSLSFRMTFTAPDRTLADAEVKEAVERVVAEARTAGAAVWGDSTSPTDA
jgi:phenylalanyl-tRNA synthetase beta chain